MEIEQVKARINRALSDGRLSRQESEDIKTAILADKQVTEEEHKLWRELQNLIFTGDIKLEE